MQSTKDYEADAKTLRSAMKGIGTDEDAIINLTCNRSNADRIKIKEYYNKEYKRNLLADLDDELSFNFKKVSISMYRSPAEFDSLEIYNAVKGLGTNEDTLSEIMATRNNTKLAEIKKIYKELYSESLESRIKDETSGDYRTLLLSLLECDRDESDKVDNDLVEKDIKALYKAGEGKWGTDEEVFIKIFAKRNSKHLKAINDSYKNEYKKKLTKVIDSEFSGDIKILLKTIMQFHLKPGNYFAKRIYKSCKGLGTNDEMLIRILISTDEVYMEDIKKYYVEKYKKSLSDEIVSETSGDYRRMLLGLINSK